MIGISSANEPAATQTEQIVLSHDTPHPLVIGHHALSSKRRQYSPIPVGWHFHDYSLYGIPYFHVPIWRLIPCESVVTGPARPRYRAHLPDWQLRAHFYRFLDLPPKRLPPLTLCSSCSSSIRPKTFFKKSISIVIWPILRSSSASRPSDLLPSPGNARLGSRSNSFFHRRRTFSCNSFSRATRANDFPDCTSLIASSLNSRVNCLRD